MKLIGSRDGRDGAVTIHQDVEVFASRLDAEATVVHKLRPHRYAWIQVIDGALDVNGTALTSGDGAAVSDEAELRLRADRDGYFLVFDLP